MPRLPHPWRRSRKDGKQGPWYAQVGGVKVRLADGTASKTEAGAALRRHLAEVEGATRPRAAALTVDEVLRLYLDAFKKAVDRDEKEARTYHDLEWFLYDATKHVGTTRAEALREKDVHGWIDGHATWGGSTRNAAVKSLKMALAWATRAGHVTSNPIAAMAKPRANQRTEVPSDAELDAAIAAVTCPRFRDFLVALRESGCRPGEVYTLSADRVDPDAGTWKVRNKSRRRTGLKYRTVFLTDALVAMSRRLAALHQEGPIFLNRRGTPWRPTTVARRLRKLRVALGIKADLHAYSFRHRFVTRALLHEVPVATVAALVGHADARITMSVYAKLEKETAHLRDAVRRANGRSS